MNKNTIIKSVIHSAITTALVRYYHKKGKAEGMARVNKIRSMKEKPKQVKVNEFFSEIQNADTIKEVLTFDNFLNLSQAINSKQGEIDQIARDSENQKISTMLEWEEIYRNAQKNNAQGVK